MVKTIFNLLFFILFFDFAAAQGLDYLERNVTFEKFSKEEWRELIINIEDQFQQMNTLNSKDECKILIIQQVPESEYQGKIPNVPLNCLGNFDSDKFKFRILQLKEVGTAVCRIRIGDTTKDNQLNSSFYIQTENLELKSYLVDKFQVLGIDSLNSRSVSTIFRTKGSGSEEDFCASLSQIVTQISIFFETQERLKYQLDEPLSELFAKFLFLNAISTEISEQTRNVVFEEIRANGFSIGKSGYMVGNKNTGITLSSSVGFYYRKQKMKFSYDESNQIIGSVDGNSNLQVYSSLTYKGDVSLSYLGLFGELSLKKQLGRKGSFFFEANSTQIPGIVSYSLYNVRANQSDLFVRDNVSGIDVRETSLLDQFRFSVADEIPEILKMNIDCVLGLGLGYEKKSFGGYLGYSYQWSLTGLVGSSSYSLNATFQSLVESYVNNSKALHGVNVALYYKY